MVYNTALVILILLCYYDFSTVVDVFLLCCVKHQIPIPFLRVLFWYFFTQGRPERKIFYKVQERNIVLKLLLPGSPYSYPSVPIFLQSIFAIFNRC